MNLSDRKTTVIGRNAGGRVHVEAARLEPHLDGREQPRVLEASAPERDLAHARALGHRERRTRQRGMEGSADLGHCQAAIAIAKDGWSVFV